MVSMTTASIRYELMTTAGLRTVSGDHVVIPNEAGATFGIHMERHAPHGHPEKWAVTHLASGMAAGVGPRATPRSRTRPRTSSEISAGCATCSTRR
ncbi:unnamed protein product [Burkholderia pseudomallei]|nr:unnamed protein product [Burkholderia pseudomallei]